MLLPYRALPVIVRVFCQTKTTAGLTAYTYDAANRLTSTRDVSYTWNDRGKLTHDGPFLRRSGYSIRVTACTLLST